MFLGKLAEVEKTFEDLTKQLTDPEIIRVPEKMTKIAKKRSNLVEIVDHYRKYKKITAELEDNIEMLKQETDSEMLDLIKEDNEKLKQEAEKIKQELKILLLPKDDRDDKNVILEIRAGTGGEEASLFVADLYRMYLRFTERNRWKLEELSASNTGVGGFKEVICNIKGSNVFSKLKFESGVHRVQRVPSTEASGRIHTSAVTVAILPEVDDIEINIDPNEIRFDVYRASGHGGQSVNTTDSAVRVTHLATGLVVTCQDEKSQLKNKDKAMKILKARLYDLKLSEQQSEIASNRKNQVGSGDRSERIRTYNFPQNRVTDHRINLTLYKLEAILDGDIYELIDTLSAENQAKILKEFEAEQ